MKVTFSIALLLVSVSLSAQRMYTKEWKRIDSLVEKTGLVRTALKEVNAIYLSAKKENNEVQVIRSLVYRMSLNDALSDSGRYENIALLEKEVKEAKEPARSILHSIAGGSYWHYLQLNRWQFYNRTTTKSYASNDIATWSIEQLYDRITRHYEQSIAAVKLLQSTSLEKFNPIVIKGNARHLRPTLYDLLAFRALEFFRNDERYVTKPAYAFEINDPIAFANAEKFVTYKFITSDSLSLHHRALTTYQELIRFHLKDIQPDAFIDANVDRIQFVRNFGTHPRKDELFKEALENMITRYPSTPAVTSAMYHLAEWYMEKAGMYDPVSDTTNRYAMVKAKALADKIVAMKGINTRVQGANLLKRILHKEISTKAEAVNTIGEPFRVLLNYRNVSTAFVRVVKLAAELKANENIWEEGFWSRALTLPVVKTFTVELPATHDYQRHRVETKIESLPAGNYGILVSSSKNFELDKHALTFQRIYVSDISYVNSGMKYHALHRKRGTPLVGAAVQVWEQYYNQEKRTSDFRKLETYTTDKDGFFEIKSRSNNEYGRNLFLDISTKNDRLFQGNNVQAYVYDHEAIQKHTVSEETLLFTDRSLYRPGQIVYFKGIAISRNGKDKTNSIIAKRKYTVVLYDNNRQPIDSALLTTNDFGSYSGKFTLPQGLLNGEFYISDNVNGNQAVIRVEEYKRPKFYVDIKAPAGTYRLNDTITVVGNATSYAGNNINGATVRYRVTRRAIMPMWMEGYMPRIWPPYPQQQMEIAHGSTVADANGKFTIVFTAIPDNSVLKKYHPVFHYNITADVTDINGETRTGNSTVNVGYEALKVSMSIPDKLHVDSLRSLKVTTTNMNDSFEQAALKISISKLGAPQRMFRERYWEQPDQFIMTRDEYYQQFPYDQYADESNKSKWPKQKPALEMSAMSAKDSSIKLNKKITEPGWYVIEAFTKDKFGDSVTTRNYVLLYNEKLVTPELGLLLTANKESLQPGDKVKYQFKTNADSAVIVHELLRNAGTKKQLLTKNDFGDEVEANDSDRGGMIVKVFFVRHNRVYSEVMNIAVPFLNKQLRIDYTTYRDKTLPGANEKWKVKISGMNGERVAAELLSSMYDASLDQFNMHGWRYPSLWESSLDYNKWLGQSNFTAQEGEQRYYYEEQENAHQVVYDRLRDGFDGQVATVLEGRISGIAKDGRRVAVAEQSSAKREFQQQDVTVANAAPPAADTATGQSGTFTPPPPAIQPRKNLNELAFFFPTLYTDSSGNIEFSFTSPEALTTWKWMLMAHTKDLAFGYSEKEIVTQKELMVQPNVPRFIRAGDRINFSAKVANLSTQAIKGLASLQLLDPQTGKEVTGMINKANQSLAFNATAGESVPLTFTIDIPDNYTAPLTWRLTATSQGGSAAFSDGEEDILPVLSNRMLVTETITLPVRNTNKKSFTFDKLLKSGSSSTLKHEKLVVEFTSNPAWYAVQALPYLSEQKHENAEAIFNRFYANAIAAKLANSFPRLKSVIDKWKDADTSAFLSNLQKNEDLKNILLQETPWVLEAKTEQQQKKNIALLFDMARMSSELDNALVKLLSMQTAEGGFVWYKDGPPDRYITQYILSGIGHLKKLGAVPSAGAGQINQITRTGIAYLDAAIKKEYDQITRTNKKIAGTSLEFNPIQYLYMRSFFTDVAIPSKVLPAYKYFRELAKKGWVKQNTYMRAMIALALYRAGDAQTAKKILAALQESALHHEELGMYWKDVKGGYYWYQAPVETQSVLIEAFDEVANNANAIADMKTWLLKNKQTNNWKTTKATADACYALLLQGEEWIDNEVPVTIELGESTISSPANAQAGTGYFRTTINGDSVRPAMGNVTVNLQTTTPSRPAWGGIYWQYFEDLDKVTTGATALSISKKLFVQKNTDRGPVLESLDGKNTLHVGDRVTVRMEIRTDRNLEYVHLKDMRASGMEPLNVLSEYKWKGGLGYYESTKDASTNFFFHYLPKGTHVFEYQLFVSHTGLFSNGIATIQCMYAPEFSSHSEGIKVNVVP